MSRRAASRWVALALGALVLLAGLSAALLTVHAVILAGLPYNEEGNHFDGLVVHHEGSAFVYAALAVLCWVVAVLAGAGAYRCLKRPSQGI